MATSCSWHQQASKGSPMNLFGFGVAPVPGIGPTTSPPQIAQEPQQVLKVGPWVLPIREGDVAQYFLPASASDHRTAGYMTAEQTNALMQGISDASVQAILGAGGNPNNVAWSASPGVGVATSGSQPFPGPTKIPAGVLGEAGAWYPIYKFTHPADGRQMGLYVHSIGTIDSPAIQLVYRYDPGLLEAFWNGIKELIAAIIEIAGDLLCPIICTPSAVAAVVAAMPAAAIGTMVVVGKCSCPVPQPSGPITPIAPPTPWYRQWYVIIPIVGAIGYAMFQITSKPKAATS